MSSCSRLYMRGIGTLLEPLRGISSCTVVLIAVNGKSVKFQSRGKEIRVTEAVIIHKGMLKS